MGRSEFAAKYEIVRTVARGGMADILEARDQGRRRVAIKLLRERLSNDDDIVARFHREARLAASLKSGHVARVFDFGTNENNQPYIVMEFLSGNDLAKEIRQRGALPLDEAASYVAQTCHAMIEAHDAGIVHRDLKPPNLFLADEADDERVLKVLDFGISKITKGPGDGHVTLTQTVLGSPLYMSPETFQSAKAADLRSDIWSLGVIFYEMLTGVPPFDAVNALGIGLAVTNHVEVPPSERCAHLPRSVDIVIGRALKKAPSERYQSMRELLAAIQIFLPHGHREAMPMQVDAPEDEPLTFKMGKKEIDALGSFPARKATLLGMPAPDLDDPPTRISPSGRDPDEAATRIAPSAREPTEAPTRVAFSEATSDDPPTRLAPRTGPDPGAPKAGVAPPDAYFEEPSPPHVLSLEDFEDPPTLVESLPHTPAPSATRQGPDSEAPPAEVSDSEVADPPTWVRPDAPTASIHAAISRSMSRARAARAGSSASSKADTDRAVNLSTPPPEPTPKPRGQVALWLVPIVAILCGAGGWFAAQRSRAPATAPSPIVIVTGEPKGVQSGAVPTASGSPGEVADSSSAVLSANASAKTSGVDEAPSATQSSSAAPSARPELPRPPSGRKPRYNPRGL